jgi:quercetin dioxygenase-like cupin family protein
MKRAIRWALLSAGFASVVTAVTVAVTVAPSWATPPSGLTNTSLARGTDTSHGTLPLRFGTDIAMAQITVDPGGSSGWHSHPGGAIIIVQQGALTVYHSVGSQCRTTTYSYGGCSSL